MLKSCRILLVEDEYMPAQELRREPEDVGAVVLGPEPSVQRALARGENDEPIDAAILDVTWEGRRSV